MARERLPYWQVYPGDIRKDVAFQTLSYHYRGIWWELLMLMHCSEDRGRLVSNGAPIGTSGVARLLGLSEREAEQAIQVLTSSGVASRDESGALTCRRMVREQAIVKQRREAGRLGGLAKDASKPLAKPKAKPKQNADIDIDSFNGLNLETRNPGKDKAGNLGEVSVFCREIGLTKADAEWFWHKCEGNGWTNGGKRMLDWRQTLRSWKAGGYVPSIKNPEKGKPPRPRTEAVKTRVPEAVLEPALDPVAEADFQRRLSEWKAAGRPLGGFPS